MYTIHSERMGSVSLNSLSILRISHWYSRVLRNALIQIAKCAPDGMYRCSYGEDASLSFEEARANLENKYNQMFPGPKPVKYDLRLFSPYKLHQRCSTKFRVGRVVLVGDAAHACNPFG